MNEYVLSSVNEVCDDEGSVAAILSDTHIASWWW